MSNLKIQGKQLPLSGARRFQAHRATPNTIRNSDNRGINKATHRNYYLAVFSVSTIAAVGYYINFPWVVSAAMTYWGFHIFIVSLYRKQFMIDPLTIYAIGAGVCGLGNTVGLLSQGTKFESIFFIYADRAHLMEAVLISFIGAVSVVIGFTTMEKSRKFHLPSISSKIGQRNPMILLPIAVLVIYSDSALFLKIFAPLGTLMALIQLLPHMTAFALGRIGAVNRKPVYIYSALLIAVLEAVRAFQYEFLRSMVLLPIMAYGLGLVVGSRSLRPLARIWFAPVWGALAIFIMYFSIFGQLRSSMEGGIQRYSVLKYAKADDSVDDYGALAILSRFSDFNQVSLISRIVAVDGFYHGRTLEYLTYAFIPRMIWPDKPKIAMGSWFAARVGYSYEHGDGTFTNSINMTIPGELFLNFGFIGSAIGCVIVGAFMFLLWQTTLFWSTQNNVLGNMFGFYLMFCAVTLGADIQIVVTWTAMYVLFALFTAISPKSRKSISNSSRQHVVTSPTSRIPNG